MATVALCCDGDAGLIAYCQQVKFNVRENDFFGVVRQLLVGVVAECPWSEERQVICIQNVSNLNGEKTLEKRLHIKYVLI